MNDTIEGIGARKWSFLQAHDAVSDIWGPLHLMQGTTELATITEAGDKVKFLLVTAPQLWAAANEVLKILSSPPMPLLDASESQCLAILQLQAMVAKAVGKQDWNEVSQ